MRKIYPSDEPPRLFHARTKRTAKGIHAFDTEARSLEQAVDLIAEKQRSARGAQKNKGRKPTLREEITRANNNTKFRPVSLPGGRTWVNPLYDKVKKLNPRSPLNIPHPFRGLPLQEQKNKAREMLASGCWGIGIFAYRRIAKIFGVTTGRISMWIEEDQT